MKTLVMAASRSQAGVWPLELLRKLGDPEKSDPTRWAVDVHDDWMAVSTATSVERDYEPNEIVEISNRIGRPEFYLLESHTDRIMARYIQALPDDGHIMIDNDHGWIGSVRDYKAAITSGADWLCMNTPPPGAPQQ